MDLTLLRNYFFLLSVILSALAKRNFMMKISNIECESKTPIMNMTCTQTKSSRVAGLNMYIHFTEDIYDMRFDLEVLILNKNGHWDSFFKFINKDMCEFLASKKSAPILLIARNTLRKFSNIPENCPALKGVNYYVQGLKLDPELFPPYLPEGQFLVTGSIYNTNVLVDYSIGVHIVSKKNSTFHINNVNKKYLIYE